MQVHTWASTSSQNQAISCIAFSEKYTTQVYRLWKYKIAKIMQVHNRQILKLDNYADVQVYILWNKYVDHLDHAKVCKPGNMQVWRYWNMEVCNYRSMLYNLVTTFTPLHDYVQICTTLYNIVQPCRTIYSHLQPCTTMYTQAQPCTAFYSLVWLCTTLYNIVQHCTTM